MSWQSYSAGNAISTSKRKASSVAYSANGFILRQVETVTETRWRGLTKAAAEACVTGSSSLQSDNTTTTIYYRQIGSTSDIVVVGITTGTKVDVVASRANEADGWEVVKTETVYSAGSDTGWSTTRPSAATNGVEVSRDSRSSFVFSFNGNALFARELTVVTEYRYLTQSEASAMLTVGNSACVISDTTAYTKVSAGSGGVLVSREVMTGTNVSASARYVDAEHGYTVTKTSVTHTWSGTGWSAS